jgi:hypothetical protein
MVSVVAVARLEILILPVLEAVAVAQHSLVVTVLL